MQPLLGGLANTQSWGLMWSELKEHIIKHFMQEGSLGLLVLLFISVHFWTAFMLYTEYTELREYTNRLLYEQLIQNQQVIQDNTRILEILEQQLRDENDASLIRDIHRQMQEMDF
jgi:hypothetical protein